jgi:uncharacterized C2H2 Zn-finger protein
MVHQPDQQQRIKQLLTEAVTLLLKDNLNFESELHVEGLIGVTLDQCEVMLFSMNETLLVAGDPTHQSSASEAEVEDEDQEMEMKEARARKRRETSCKRPKQELMEEEEEEEEDVDYKPAARKHGAGTKKRAKCKKSVTGSCTASKTSSALVDDSAVRKDYSEMPHDDVNDSPDGQGILAATARPLDVDRTGNVRLKAPSSRAAANNKSYQCDECGKFLSNSKTLKVHMRIHTDEKPYQCAFCSKQFRQLANLKCHLTMHTGNNDDEEEVEGGTAAVAASDDRMSAGDDVAVTVASRFGSKLFACVYCDRQFPFRSGFVNHMRSAHDTVIGGTASSSIHAASHSTSTG